MIDLKLKCSICGKEESNKDLIKKVAENIKEYGLKAEHYLNFLNLMSGKCLNSDEHSFLFDEEFIASVNEYVTKYKANLTETEKLKVLNTELKKEADELIIKVQELQSKYDSNEQRLQNIYKDSSSIYTVIGESTGYENIEIWY